MGRIRETFLIFAENDTFLSWTKEIFLAILIVIVFWGGSLLLRYLLTSLGARIARISRTDLDDRILVRVTPPLELFTVFAGLYLAVRTLSLPDRAHLYIAGAIFIVNAAIFTNIAYRVIDEILSWYARRVEERTGSGMGMEILFLVRKVFTIFLACSALIIILKHFGYDILSLLTALGIGSLAIGLAAKDTLANMISGFTLMIDRPFRIGDRIQLLSGKAGDVVDIGLRSTRIRTPDNTLLIIPNSELCNSSVINMAFPDLKTQGRVAVGVAYGADLAVAKRIMVESALADDDVLRDPSPEAFFISFGDNALNITLIFWVADYTKLFSATDRINSAVLAGFTMNDIQIPYPTRKVVLEREG